MEKNELKFYTLVIFLLILLMPIAFSAKSGETVTLATIEKCVGKASIRVTSTQNITDGEYTILGCYSDAINSWQCQCDTLNSTIVSLKTLNSTNNVYNIGVAYSIAEEIPITNQTNTSEIQLIEAMNLANKRQIRVDGLQINNEQVVAKKEPFKMPVLTPAMFKLISTVLLVILLVVVFAVLMVIKFIFNSPENSLDYIKPLRPVPKKETIFDKLSLLFKPRVKEVIPKKEEVNDKEVEDILKKINKE